MLVATLFNLIYSFVTSIYFLSLLAFLFVLFIAAYLYVTRHFGKWEKKYGIKGLEPVPFLGTEKDMLTGAKSLAAIVVERYKQFDGHK
jgi:hypothetical protein